MIQARLTKDWMPTVLTVVLYLQASLASLVGLASVLGVTSFAHTMVDGRRLGVGFWAFAFMLVAVVVPQIKENQRLFIVPLAWTAFHLTDSLFEFLVKGDALFLPPLMVESAFLIAYVYFFRVLSKRRSSSYGSGA